MPENRILVVRGGAVGDFILTLPVLSALRKQFPATQLTVLGYPRLAALATWGGLVDSVRSLEDRPVAHFFARHANLERGWQEFFGGFAIIISYLFDPDGIFQENVSRCSKAQFIVGPHRPSDFGHLHATEVFLEPLKRLAIFDPDPIPRLKISEHGKQNGKAPGILSNSHLATTGISETLEWSEVNKPIAFHPGSGSERKNWPEVHWKALLKAVLEDSQRSLLLIGGEAEGERLASLAAGLPMERIRVVDNWPLTDVAAVLTRCRQFLGHDSGISHLSAAVGTPTTVLWGPTIERVWRPRGVHVTILNPSEGLATLSVQNVIASIS